MKKMIIAGLLTLAMTGVTFAAPTLTLTGSKDASNWYVWANVSQGDNFGLSFVSFKVSSVTGTQSLKAPQLSSYIWDPMYDNGLDEYGDPLPPGAYVEEYKAMFGQQRNSQLVVGSTNNSFEYIAGMNTANDIAAKRGMGQGPVTFAYTKNNGAPGTYTLPASLQNNTIAPGALLIAQGTLLPGSKPGFNLSLGYNGNVFNAMTGSSVTDVGVDGTIILRNVDAGGQFLPEPATLALLGLGGVATLLRRRRRS
jgi:hypothetical protein